MKQTKDEVKRLKIIYCMKPLSMRDAFNKSLIHLSIGKAALLTLINVPQCLSFNDPDSVNNELLKCAPIVNTPLRIYSRLK